MRLKSVEGPLSVYNGNPDVVNSPKRNNTVQNSNLRSVRAIYNNSNLSSHYISSNDNCNLVRSVGTERDENALDNINNSEGSATVQWYSNTARAQFQAISDNVQNRKQQLFNIDSTLAVSLENARQVRASSTSIYSESSPDDSLLDYEDVRQSCSSSDSSPQDEDRIFDISDCESLSEDINLSNSGSVCKRRGIVNPNYPGFQHLAHTLDYSIKATSDTDFTDDDDFESESVESRYVTETNNINNINNNNNNNNNNTEKVVECPFDKIDGVNRLDSDENTQKVFYDKDVFNISLETGGNDYQVSSLTSGDDSELVDQSENAKSNKVFRGKGGPETTITDDFCGGIAHELERVCLNNNFPRADESDRLSELVQIDLERAAEKLTAAKDLQPTATKYKYEPNIEQPLIKTSLRQPGGASPTINDSRLEMKVPVLRALPEESLKLKFSDAFLSDVQDCIPAFYKKASSDENLNDYKLVTMEFDVSDKPMLFNNDLADIDSYRQKKVYDRSAFNQNKIIASADQNEEAEKFCKEDKTKDEPEKDEDSAVPRKKERIEVGSTTAVRDSNQQIGTRSTPLVAAPRREHAAAGGKSRENYNRHTIPGMRETKATNSEFFGGFDVYNIETAMPKIDLEAIEWHLRAAREEERRRRTDREEIRKRLAMGSEDDHYNHLDRPGRKPSLQARLQSGMNLQICFMNETVSDSESPNSDTESAMTNLKSKPSRSKTRSADQEKEKCSHPVRPASLAIGQSLLHRVSVSQPMTESDFFARQGRLQTEARMALAQAKEMARMQMEIERQRQEKSPIAEMVRHSLEKVGIPFPEDRRRLSRQILTEMNLAQLQVIVNDLHSQIETLNENLVKFLMHRDDLHMEQDSMLVDIEDLTRYLGAKEQSFKEQNQNQTTVQHNNNMSQPPSPAPSALSLPILSGGFMPLKPHFHTIGNLLKN